MFGLKNRAKRAEELCLRGKAFADNKKWAEALTEFDRAIALDPSRAPFYSMRGIARRTAGQLEGALEDLNTALGLEPPNRARLFQRALVYQAMRNYQLCLVDLDAATRLDPQFAPIYSTRAYNYRAMGRHDKAVQDFERFAQMRPEVALTYYSWACSLQELGDGEGALEQCKRAIEIDPAMRAARLLLASLSYDKGDSQGAVGEISELIAGSTEPAQLSHWLAARAAAYRSMGREDLAGPDEAQVRKLHKHCVQIIVRAGGRITWGALVQANSTLYQPGIFDMLCLVVISFEADLELDRECKRLRQIAERLSSLKGTSQSDPDLAYAATLTTNEYTNSDARLRVPEVISGGLRVYTAGLVVRRQFLEHRVITTSILPCIATPGDQGTIEMLPFDFRQKSRPA